jgi:hypothetical protein
MYRTKMDSPIVGCKSLAAVNDDWLLPWKMPFWIFPLYSL